MVDDADYIYPLYHYRVAQGVSTLDIDIDDPSTGTMLIGIYSSRTNAEAAIERLRNNPRFRDWTGGFRVYHSELDAIESGEEGFISSDEA